MDPVEQDGRRARTNRVALVASGVAVVAIAAMLAATFVIQRDRDRATRPDANGLLGVPERTGRPDVEAMLDTPLLSPTGSETTLRAQLGGRAVLVNQWSKTCAPCVEEMPWLQAVSRANPDVRFFGVNNLDGLGAARSMAERTGITYPWARDPAGDFAHAARTVGLPDTMLFAPDGRLLASRTGKFADRAEIQRFIDDHLPGGGR